MNKMYLSAVAMLFCATAGAGSVEQPESGSGVKRATMGTGAYACETSCFGEARDGSLVASQPVGGYGDTQLMAYNNAVGACIAKVEFASDTRIVQKYLAHEVQLGKKTVGNVVIDGLFVLGADKVTQPSQCR